MKIQYGFTSVTLMAMLAFRDRLDEGEWATVEALPLEELELDTPALVVVKSSLIDLLNQAAVAISPEEQTLTDLDARWDRAQRRWALALMSAQLSDDADERAAAEQLAAETLSGTSGTEQTGWTYQDEVNWGAVQLNKLSAAPLAPHVGKLKLEGHVKDIKDANQALSLAIGRSADTPAKEARWRRERRVQALIAIQLNAAMGMLDTLARSPRADLRRRLDDLRRPFLYLLDNR